MANFKSLLFAGVAASSMLGAVPVLAQTAAPAATTVPAAPQAERAAETVIVTGSRIRRNPANSVSPLIQVTQETILNSGESNVIDYLADIPALQNSQVQEDTVGVLNALGLSLLNLRDLGANRTLVLVDGRRHVGAPQGSLSVDVDTIPRLLTQSTEIVTGGQGAVYGADAVSGVVNYIMKKDFDGLDADVSLAEINEGGQQNQRVSLLAGKNLFDDKLNIYLSGEWQKGEEVRDGDMDWRRQGWALIANDVDTTAIPSDGNFDAILVNNLRNISRLYGGAIVLAGNPQPSPAADPLIPFQTCSAAALPAASTNFRFNFGAANAACFAFDPRQNKTLLLNPDGSVRAPNYGTFQGQVGLSRATNIGGDGLNVGTEFSQGSRVPPEEAFRWQGGFNFKLTPEVTLFGEAKFIKEESYTETQPTFFNIGIAAPVAGQLPLIAATSAFNVGLDNPFINPTLRAAIQSNTRPVYNAAGAVVATIADPRAQLTVFGPLRDQINERETQRYVIGAKGFSDQLGFIKDISWDVGYTFGQAKNINTERAVDVIRFAHAADVVVDTAGTLGRAGANVCRVKLLVAQGVQVQDPNAATGTFYTASNPTVANCVPQSVFGVNMRSRGYAPESEAYYDAGIRVRHTNEQENFLGTFAGNLWDFWGAGPIGFSVGYEYRKESAVGVGRSTDTAGRLLFLNTGADFPDSTYDVNEYFVEGRLPLLKDSRFGKFAEISGAFRRSEYSGISKSEPEQDTYSFTAAYRPVDSLLMRASSGRAIRVPSLSDAFSPLTQTFANGFADPCDRLSINAQSAEVQGFRRTNCAALLGSNWSGDAVSGTLITYTSGVPGFNGGNPTLTPEVSDSVTGGFAWTPRFDGFLSKFKRMNVVIDWYRIEIENVIAAVTMPVAAAACVSQAALNPGACSSITRNGFIAAGDPNNFRVVDFIQGSINYARSNAEGVDYTLSFNIDMKDIFGANADYGYFQYSLNGAYNIKQDDYFNIALPTVSTAFDGTLERPKSRFNSVLAYTPNKKWTFTWEADWQSSQGLLGDTRILETDTDNRPLKYIKTGSFTQHDLSIRYNYNDQLTLRAGVVNVTDAEPARWLGSGTSADNFDLWGRRVFIGFRYRG